MKTNGIVMINNDTEGAWCEEKLHGVLTRSALSCSGDVWLVRLLIPLWNHGVCAIITAGLLWVIFPLIFEDMPDKVPNKVQGTIFSLADNQIMSTC